MRLTGTTLPLSPPARYAFLGCRHHTGLDLSVVRGLLAKPRYVDPMLWVVLEKGEQQEKQYVDWLRDDRCSVVHHRKERNITATRAALVSGADAVVQATLENTTWGGSADILRRVEEPSGLGSAYEVNDTKLARAAAPFCNSPSTRNCLGPRTDARQLRGSSSPSTGSRDKCSWRIAVSVVREAAATRTQPANVTG